MLTPQGLPRLLQRAMVWAILLTPLWFSAAVISTILLGAHIDWWHWGTVAAVSLTLLAEAWYGVCKQSDAVAKKLYPDAHARALPWFDRLLVRITEKDYFEGHRGEVVAELEAHPRFGGRVRVYSSVVRASGRFALAAFVIAGFSVGKISFPWFVSGA